MTNIFSDRNDYWEPVKASRTGYNLSDSYLGTYLPYTIREWRIPLPPIPSEKLLATPTDSWSTGDQAKYSGFSSVIEMRMAIGS